MNNCHSPKKGVKMMLTIARNYGSSSFGNGQRFRLEDSFRPQMINVVVCRIPTSLRRLIDIFRAGRVAGSR
jgi:hypothetical protein